MNKPTNTIKWIMLVEGETEKLYFEHLQYLVNEDCSREYKLKLECKVGSKPDKYVKTVIIGPISSKPTKITHVFDYESNEEYYQKQFSKRLDLMKDAEKMRASVKFELGYTNFAFELWIILHKELHLKPYKHRSEYLNAINRLYDMKFESLDKYKQKDSFTMILKKISMQDIFNAVRYAEKISTVNKEREKKLERYKGYEYYRENPSLSLWIPVKRILSECELK